MSRALNIASALVVLALANFICGTFLVVCRFREWDIAATITSTVLSVYIVHTELSNKWSYIGKEAFKNTLIIGVLLGGASAFFWFFHMIYKIGHYQGDISALLWTSPTRLIAFAISLYLIVISHRIYANLTLECEENQLGEDAVPLSLTTLLKNNFHTTGHGCKKQNFNPA